MNRAQLLQHFEALAETPEAVAKLRNFILSLAVRGQLSSQYAEEEKHPRWKEFAAKFDRSDMPDAQSSFPTPKSWRWVRLNDVADYRAADKVDPSQINDADWVLDLEEIEKDTSRILRIARFQEKQSSSTKAKFLPGDVLYGKLRPYLNKVAVAPKGGFCTTEIVPIRSRGIAEPAYLCLYLRSPDFVDYANSKSYGMKMPRLGTEDAELAWVAVPPPSEQQRIVAKVDELLALCDELERRQTAAREHRARLVHSALDHLTTAKQESDFKIYSSFCIQHSELLFDSVPALRQAILSLAVQGRLVAQNSADGTGREIIRRILKNSGHVSSTPENASEDLPTLPLNWAPVAMSDIFEVAGGIQKTPMRAPRANAFPYLRVANVQRGRLDLSDVQEFELFDGEIDRLRLKPADVLLVEGNGSEDEIGRCAQWQGQIADCVHQNHIIRCRPLGHDARFVILFLNSPLGVAEMKRRAITTSGLYSLSVGKIRSLTVPFPPLAEQKRIVAKVDELMRWCDALESRLTAAQTTTTALLDATLHKILAT